MKTDYTMTPYARFSELLRGMRITDKLTGREVHRYEIFDDYWFKTAEQIKQGIHSKYEAEPKRKSKTLSQAFSEN